MPKIYWVQVEGEPTESALGALRVGVQYADFTTRPARVRRLPEAEVANLWPRDPPIRIRKAIPTAGIEIIITEGKNRQVRRMTAHVGLPTLRLIRVGIGALSLDGLAPGAWQEIQASYSDLAG